MRTSSWIQLAATRWSARSSAKEGGILVSIVQPLRKNRREIRIRALFYGGHPVHPTWLKSQGDRRREGKDSVETVLPLAEARRAHELSQAVMPAGRSF